MRARHTQLADWLDLPRPDREAEFGSIKQRLAAEGVNARGWRLYLEYGDALFDALGQPFLNKDCPLTSSPNAIAFLKLLAGCEMDVPPPCALVATMRDWMIPGDRIEIVPVHFFRALWKATLLHDYGVSGDSIRMQAFLRESLVPLAAWFFSTGRHLDIDSNKLKAGWLALQRDHQEWALVELKAKEARKPFPPEWPPFVTAVECGGLRFVALASDAALILEGDEMSHCIGGYGNRCRREMLRAYSVRDKKSGMRVATLTVTESKPGRWNIDVIKGHENNEVPDKILQSAYGVIRTLEDAYALNPTLRRDMDGIRSKLGTQVTRDCYDEIPF